MSTPFFLPALFSTMPNAFVKTSQAPAKPDSTEDQLRWFSQLQNAFTENPQEKKTLLHLWNKGVLSDNKGDDAHSTLYYLNKRLQEPCLPGLDSRQTVAETVNLLADSSRLTQNISPLNANHLPLMMSGYHNPNGSPYQQDALPVPASAKEIQPKQLNSCSVLGEIGRLVDTHPKEVARMIYEASNPTQDIHEIVTADKLFPDAPILAEQVLKDLNLDYHILDEQETLKKNAPTRFQVSMPVPHLGVIRAMNAQEVKDPNTASGAELLLEEALLYNFTSKSYDAGRDTRDALALSSASINNAKTLTPQDKEALNKIINQSPRRPDLAKEGVKAYLSTVTTAQPEELQAIHASLDATASGLTQEEQLMLERILEDDIALENVTYQQVGIDNTAQNKEDAKHVLLGYTKPFTAIKQDVLQGLASPLGQILANVVEPKGDGSFEKGHVVRVIASRTSPLKIPNFTSTDFLVQDTSKAASSQGSRTQWWHESQLIPRIHHITEVQSDAEKAWQSMTPATPENPYGLLSGDKANDARYTLDFVTRPPDESQVLETPEAFHRRVHDYRHKQATQAEADFKAKQGGPSQNKTESSPVLWGEARHA
ncbi:MAG: hypothetical protein ACK5T0_04300 [Vampirovibrionales bacterium]